MAKALGYSLAAASENDVTLNTGSAPKSVAVYMYKNGDGNNGEPFLSCTLPADKGTVVYKSPTSPVVVMLGRLPDGTVQVFINAE